MHGSARNYLYERACRHEAFVLDRDLNRIQFHWLDGIAMDSLGNIYTGEVDDGKRVQKFVLLNGDGVRRFRPHD